MDSGKERSRSRSKRARLEAAKQAGPEGVSIVDIMRSSPDYKRIRNRSTSSSEQQANKNKQVTEKVGYLPFTHPTAPPSSQMKQVAKYDIRSTTPELV